MIDDTYTFPALEAIREHLPPDIQLSAFTDLVNSYRKNLELAEAALERAKGREVAADEEAKKASTEWFTARCNCRRIYAILRAAEKLLKDVEKEFKNDHAKNA